MCITCFFIYFANSILSSTPFIYEFKNKNNKKAGGLVYGTFVDKNKVIIFSYEYKAGRDEEHESEYEYLMSDTEYGYYD